MSPASGWRLRASSRSFKRSGLPLASKGGASSRTAARGRKGAGDMLAAPVQQIFGRCRAGKHRRDNFPPDGIGPPGDHDRLDARTLRQQKFHRCGMNFLPAADDGFVGAAQDRQVPFGRNLGEIVGDEPAVGKPVAGRKFRVCVAVHEHGAAHLQPAVVGEGDFGAFKGAADLSRAPVGRQARQCGDLRAGLAHPVGRLDRPAALRRRDAPVLWARPRRRRGAWRSPVGAGFCSASNCASMVGVSDTWVMRPSTSAP